MPWTLIALGAVLLLASRRSTPTVSPTPSPSGPASLISAETVASFYGPSYHGRQTANQETFDKNAMTAAMRSPMPFNTRVRVTDLDNGRSVVVRINDRGPFVKNSAGQFTRDIDLSEGAAAVIGLDIQKGLARVRLERV